MAMNGTSALGITMLVLAAFFCACGGRQLESPMTPDERARERASELVDDAVDRGVEADEDQEIFVFPIRYNPVDGCNCPDWEIVFRGRWTRVFLNAESDDQLVLDELTEQAAADLDAAVYATYRAAGRLLDEVTLEQQTGLEYRTFQLVRPEGDVDLDVR